MEYHIYSKIQTLRFYGESTGAIPHACLAQANPVDRFFERKYIPLEQIQELTVGLSPDDVNSFHRFWDSRSACFSQLWVNRYDHWEPTAPLISSVETRVRAGDQLEQIWLSSPSRFDADHVAELMELAGEALVQEEGAQLCCLSCTDLPSNAPPSFANDRDD